MIRRSILVGISLSCLFACSDASTDVASDASSDAELSRRQGEPPAAPPSQGRPPAAPGMDGAETPTDAPAVAGGPRVVAGNPSSCAAVIPGAADLLTFKVDPAKTGTYTSSDGALTVTIDASEKTFSFTSDVPLRWVVVKGGPAANIYEFSPAVLSASGLVAPDGKGLSHLDFCYPPPGGGEGGSGGGGGDTGGMGGTSTGTGGTGTGTGGSDDGGPGGSDGGPGGSGAGGDDGGGSAGDAGEVPCSEDDDCQL